VGPGAQACVLGFFLCEAPVSGSDTKLDFGAPAVLRKWPSLGNQRREDRDTYLVLEGTLDACITSLMARPEATRHLYEIHTAPQPPLVTEILSSEHVVELSRLREFL
jgi:hypothetical protein